jgi:hypothetical protein
VLVLPYLSFFLIVIVVATSRLELETFRLDKVGSVCLEVVFILHVHLAVEGYGLLGTLVVAVRLQDVDRWDLGTDVPQVLIKVPRTFSCHL